MQNQHARATRGHSDPTHHLAFGPFRLDPAGRRLWRGSQLLSLPPKALDLLITLIDADGQLVEKDTLMRRLWPDTFVSEESLTQSVSALRRALGDDAAHPEFIATLPRRGYRFVAPVARHDAPASELEAPESWPASSRIIRLGLPARPDSPHTRDGRDRLTIAAVAIAIAAAAVLVTFLTMSR